MPTGAPASIPVRYTTWDEKLAKARSKAGAMRSDDLGRLRVEVLRTLATRPDTDDPVPDNVVRASTS